MESETTLQPRAIAIAPRAPPLAVAVPPERRRALLSLPTLVIAFAVGIAGAQGFAWTSAAWAFIASFASVACLRTTPAWAAPFLFFALGVWRGASLPARPPAPVPDPYPAIVRGVVIEPPVRDADRPLWHFSIWADGIRADVRASFPPRLSEGDHVRLIGACAPRWYGGNPGDAASFNHQRAQWRCGSLTLEGPAQIEALTRASSPAPLVTAAARSAIHAIFPPRIEGLALGLFLGDRRTIPRAQLDDFTRSGTAHLLAISGLNVALIASAIYFLALRLFGPCLRGGRAWGQDAALVASASGAFVYAVLSGYSPSAARAAVGVLLATLVFLRGRRVRPMDLLCAVAFTILYLNPELLWSISLQLSVAAVAGILRFGTPPPVPPLVRRLARPQRIQRLAARLVITPARISLAAFLGSLLVSIHHFGVCHPWGVAASMATCPLLAVALTSGGAAIVLAPVCLIGAKIVALPAIVSLYGIIACNALFASLPLDTIPFPATRPAIVVLGGLCMLFPRPRVALFGVVASLLGAVLFPRPCSLREGALECPFPGGRVFLYRSGPQIVAYVDGVRLRDLGPMLHALALKSVDVLVMPHPIRGLPLKAAMSVSEPAVVRLRAGFRIEVRALAAAGLGLRIRDDEACFTIDAQPPRAPPSSSYPHPPVR